MARSLILGEFRRALDERYRVTIPSEMTALLATEDEDCVLAKERVGALSLWNAAAWRAKLDQGIHLVQEKLAAGRLEGRTEDLQTLGRLLSTRHATLRLSGRGRLLIPEGFREFLGVEPGGEIFVVGAAVCVELWRPDRWFSYVQENVTGFGSLLGNLSK
jgi:MraZ protein